MALRTLFIGPAGNDLYPLDVIISFFEVVPGAPGLDAETSHSGHYGEFPQRRPGVRGAAAVTK